MLGGQAVADADNGQPGRVRNRLKQKILLIMCTEGQAAAMEMKQDTAGRRRRKHTQRQRTVRRLDRAGLALGREYDGPENRSATGACLPDHRGR